MRRWNLCCVIALAAFLLAGCWYHRVDVPSPVTNATESSETTWSFLWRSKQLEPDPTCVNGLKEVVVRSNWVFSLLKVATLGLVAPARVERHCARATIIDEAPPPDTAANGPPGGATYWSLVWGTYQREPRPPCNDRPIAKVILKINPVFDLLSVVSLGAASPARIRWECVPSRGAQPSSAGAAK